VPASILPDHHRANLVGAAPENEEAQRYKDVCACVEETIEERIQFQVFDRRRGIPGAGRHMMPLEHLTEDNAVKKTRQGPGQTEYQLPRETFCRWWTTPCSIAADVFRRN
jgi:hypothetical protein